MNLAEKLSDRVVRGKLAFVLQYVSESDCACGGAGECVVCDAINLQQTLLPQTLPVEEAMAILQENVATDERRDWELQGCPEHHTYTALNTVLEIVKQALSEDGE